MSENKYSTPETKKKAYEYWKMRRQDLKCMFLPEECSIEELEAFLDEEGIEIPDSRGYDELEEYKEALEELAFEVKYDYGLSVDIVEPCTFKDQPDRFLRYQFSWGGGQDELRFYFNCGDDVYDYAEFWYLDWFTGHGIDVSNDEVVDAVWDWLYGIYYDQIKNCVDDCSQYDNCDPEYVPEECKDYIGKAVEIAEKLSDEEVVEAVTHLLFSEIEDMIDEIIEDNENVGDIGRLIDRMNRETTAESVMDVLNTIKERDEDAYDDIIDVMRDRLIEDLESYEEDAVWLYNWYR